MSSTLYFYNLKDSYKVSYLCVYILIFLLFNPEGVVKPSTAEIISMSDVEKEWKKQKTEFHQYLVDYFRCQPHCQRKVEELPWQLLMAGDMLGLVEVLADPEYV